MGLAELHACPFPDVVFLPFLLSALSSFPFHYATGDMTIPLQFASLYDGQEVFVWPSCLLDLGVYFLGGSMAFV